MNQVTVWQPTEDIEKAFWKLVNSLWAKQRAAVSDGVPCIPLYERNNTESTASLTFFYPKSSVTAHFRFTNGAWSAVNRPNDWSMKMEWYSLWALWVKGTVKSAYSATHDTRSPRSLVSKNVQKWLKKQSLDYNNRNTYIYSKYSLLSHWETAASLAIICQTKSLGNLQCRSKFK